MYGLNNIVTTLKNTLLHNSNSGSLGRVALNSQQNGNAFDVVLVPLSDVKTDEKNFQNRGDKYSAKSVQSIIDAVGNGNFNWFAFDPVILWENADGEKFVLSGHSRTQAFREITEKHPDWQVDGIYFNAIPARIYKGSFESAKQLALNSNTLATPETITERAAYFRNLREQNSIKGGKELQTLRKKALKENNGQMIWDISFLPGDGISFNALKSFKLGEQDGSPENFLRLATICQWIGKAFQIYKGLSAAHDRELFNFLMNGGYGSKSGQYFNFTSLNDRLQKLYENNVADERKVNARSEYTEPFQIAAYKKNDSEIEELTQLKKESDDAFKELKKKFKELRENNATREQIFEIATPYFNQWVNKLYAWWQLLDRVPKQDNTPSLFGIDADPAEFFIVGFNREDPRIKYIAEAAIKNSDGTITAIKSNLKNFKELQYISDWSDWQEGDNERINFLISRLRTTNPKKRITNVKDIENRIKRWVYLQKMWGRFIEAISLFLDPKKLISKYFRVRIVYETWAKDIIKDFTNIADALDYAFQDGYLTKNTFTIENDKGEGILTNNHLPSRLYGIMNDIFVDKTLGKPTIKFEFETNEELKKFLSDNKDNLIDSYIDVDAEEYNDDKKKLPRGVHGLTVNNKPAAVFNCSESELQTQGYKPTYKRLKDYSSLIDFADGAKTLKGYGFDNATLDELLNACTKYKQVEKLAAHLKDADKLQSAFNVWHWLHTNINYNYDTPGQEEIRTPARVWRDRYSGVDCDCLAVFTACLFLNMGYKPYFEIVAFNNSPTYSHIYVNLDGYAIDRVLPVFLARPSGITKTKFMAIPVYELSGIGKCSTLQGVYDSTLYKMQQGNATTDEINNFRKTQILLTLKGFDEDLYKVAALLMPHVVTISDDGKYYFDSKKAAEVAKKADAQLALMKQQNLSDIQKKYLMREIIDELDGITADSNDNDTIVIIINPKGISTPIMANMVESTLPNLEVKPDATDNAGNTVLQVYQTTAAPAQISTYKEL